MNLLSNVWDEREGRGEVLLNGNGGERSGIVGIVHKIPLRFISVPQSQFDPKEHGTKRPFRLLQRHDISAASF